MPVFTRHALVLVLCFSCFVYLGLKVADPPGVQMKIFAESFLSSLDQDQRSTAVMPYDSSQRVQWHFIPKKERKGLMLREMNTAQQTAALRLLRSALSESGYEKANKIILLEDVLRELEGDTRRWDRDPNMYYVTIFGTPSDRDAWGMSFEGHHLSLNFVCRDGRVVDSTPQFFASNPATITVDVKGPLGKGTRVLKQEEDLAFELLNSLGDDQRDDAIIAAEAPAEIRFAGEPQPKLVDPDGIPLTKLNDSQQKLLKELVNVYVSAVAEEVADQRRDLIESNGWGNVHFAWAGATEPGVGHYYRIVGKEFLIEFVNTQPDAIGNPANHIHCVWRDLTGDFDLPIQ